MDTKKILEKINNYNHLITLYLGAEEQLEQLKATAPEAYAALLDDIGSIALEKAIGELCLIAGKEEVEVIEMLTTTEPNASMKEMGQRWDDLWSIYNVAVEIAPSFNNILDVVNGCIAEQRQMIVAAGYDEKLDVLV